MKITPKSIGTIWGGAVFPGNIEGLAFYVPFFLANEPLDVSCHPTVNEFSRATVGLWVDVIVAGLDVHIQ